MNWTQQDVDELYRRRQFPNAEKIAPPKPKSKSHGTHTPGQMNKTEARCARYLDLMKKAGDVLEWYFEGVTLKIGPDCRYTVDFVLLMSSGEVHFWDVKARRKGKLFAEEDSKVKIRAATDKFRALPWKFCWALENTNGSWQEIPVVRE